MKITFVRIINVAVLSLHNGKIFMVDILLPLRVDHSVTEDYSKYESNMSKDALHCIIQKQIDCILNRE